MKISFDFDCTLGEDIFQKLASILISSNVDSDVYIITARNKGESYNRDLLNVAARLKIPEQNIFYTEGNFKWKKIQELNIKLHIDDVPEECFLIAKNTKCIPLLIWDSDCAESIKHDSFGKGIF